METSAMQQLRLRPLWRYLAHWVLLIIVGGLVACGTVPQDHDPRPSEDPDSKAAASPQLQAVMQLSRDGSQALQQGDYQAAIAAAERGLRIDRRVPELYLILAKSYQALGNPQQAQQFAEQGLRYVDDSRQDTGQALRQLLRQPTF